MSLQPWRSALERVLDRRNTWGPPSGGPTANAIVDLRAAEAGPHVLQFAALRSPDGRCARAAKAEALRRFERGVER